MLTSFDYLIFHTILFFH